MIELEKFANEDENSNASFILPGLRYINTNTDLELEEYADLKGSTGNIFSINFFRNKMFLFCVKLSY